MYNTKYVIACIIIFLAIVLFPVGYNLASGESFPVQLEKPKGDHCIENKKWMVENHMELLKDWRTMKIREAMVKYVSRDYGESYNLSLATCFECHSKKESCDACHEYTGVSHYCFTACHEGVEVYE
ncbi:MAG: sulfur reduction protein DsrJ [Archaeoglobales archaeon]|nr:MAG: sulfur reduction protein DsrJ [Archaeoglobales archaeon]